MKSDFLKLQIEILTLNVFGVVAVVQPSEETATIGAAVIGATLGGFVATYFSRFRDFKTWMLRWMVNLCCGIPGGMVVTALCHNAEHEIPVTWFALSAAFIAGPVGVLLIPVAIPLLANFTKAWLASKANSWTPPKSNPENPPPPKKDPPNPKM